MPLLIESNFHFSQFANHTHTVNGNNFINKKAKMAQCNVSALVQGMFISQKNRRRTEQKTFFEGAFFRMNKVIALVSSTTSL